MVRRTPSKSSIHAMGSTSGKPPEQAATPEPDSDSDLFRNAVGAVRRLDDVPARPAPPRPRPRARMAEHDEQQARVAFARILDADQIEAGDSLSWRREDVPGHVLRRLKRGLYAAQEELDLHGANAATAEQWLRQFLRHAHQQGLGCVRIVHGKGSNADSPVPVLKNLVDRVLRQRADIAAFHSAPTAQGGTGAVLVLLRRG